MTWFLYHLYLKEITGNTDRKTNLGQNLYDVPFHNLTPIRVRL